MPQGSIPDHSKAAIAMALEDPGFCGLPAPVQVDHPQFTDHDLTGDQIKVDDPNITGKGVVAAQIAGKREVAGTINAAGTMAFLIPWRSGLRAVDAIDGTALVPGLVFEHKYGISEAVSTPTTFTFWNETGAGDGGRRVSPGTVASVLTITIESGGTATFSAECESQYESVWEPGEKTHTSPATGSLLARGLTPGYARRSGDGAVEARSVYMRMLDNSNPLRPTFTALMGRPALLTGTWSVAGPSITATAAGDGNALEEMFPGDVIYLDTDPLEIAAVISKDEIEFTKATLTIGPVSIYRDYGGAADVVGTDFGPYGDSANGDGGVVQPGQNTDGTIIFNQIIQSSGGLLAGERARTGKGFEVSLTSVGGIPVPVPIALLDTITTVIGSRVVTGGGSSAFDTILTSGSKVTTLGGTVIRVRRVLTATTFEATAPLLTAEAGVTGTRTPIPTVALTGTVTTNGTTALVSSGGLLVDLGPVGPSGAWILTAGGEELLVDTIDSDTTATLVRPAVGSEVAAAAVTDFSWRFGDLEEWAVVEHPAGPFGETIEDVRLKVQSAGGGDEFEVNLAQTLTLAFSTGLSTSSGVGQTFSPLSEPGGNASSEPTFVIREPDLEVRRLVESGDAVRLKVEMPTGVKIPGTIFEYGIVLVFHFDTGTGKSSAVAGADDNTLEVPGFGQPDPSDLEFPSLVTMVTIDTVEFPIATTPYV